MKSQKKSMKCACGKIAAYKADLKFNGYPLDGWICKSCGETYHNPKKAEAILLLNKLKRQKFIIRLGRMKSNLIFRIPKKVSDALSLQKGGQVEFFLKDNETMVIKPVKC